MFSKTHDQTLPTSAHQPTGGFAKSVLAADLAITGEVISSSAIEVLGKIDGQISAKSLTVGVEGRVKGSISADNVDLRGTFDGTIATQNLSLRASCTVQAQVRYATLSIESGAVVEGQFTVNKL